MVRVCSYNITIIKYIYCAEVWCDEHFSYEYDIYVNDILNLFYSSARAHLANPS